MRHNSRNGRAAFTLIELMAVIAIIAILAGLVVGSMSFVKERENRDTAKVQIALLEKAIEEYKLDMGKYPGEVDNTESDGDISEQLYEALFYDGHYYSSQAQPPANWTKATKIYLPELDPTNTTMKWVTKAKSRNLPDSMKILDPWKHAYRYRKGTNAENPDFDLWSMGKDGKSDFQNSAISRPSNRDDIRNF